MRPLSLCTFVISAALAEQLQRWSEQPQVLERYRLQIFHQAADFLRFVDREQHQIDCLILQDSSELATVFDRLQAHATLLPAVVLFDESSDFCALYLNATRYLAIEALSQLDGAIDEAMSKFLAIAAEPPTAESPVAAIAVTSSLLLQQRRLADKLKQRLGDWGLYYKRNPRTFFKRLDLKERQALLDQLKSEYSGIVLQYFTESHGLNERIDLFVNQAFFANVPVDVIVQIHMELMDEFSKQLKLEGRSEEILLDYRLTLIDTLAHLCEMYRRSHPQS